MEHDADVAQLEQVWRAHVLPNVSAQLACWRAREPDVEIRLSVPTPSSQQVLVAHR